MLASVDVDEQQWPKLCQTLADINDESFSEKTEKTTNSLNLNTSMTNHRKVFKHQRLRLRPYVARVSVCLESLVIK